MAGAETMTVSDSGAARRPRLRAVEPQPPQAGDSHALAAQVGAEVASALSVALDRVNLLVRSGRIGRHSLRALRDEIEHARRIAMMGQQLGRLAAGRVRQTAETLDLPQVLRDALLQRAGDIESRGLDVRQSLKPACASVDPTLLFALLQSLLDWVFEHTCGQVLNIGTDQNAWPVHALLTCQFEWRPADEGDAAAELRHEAERAEGCGPLDTLAWRLVVQTADTLGLHLTRHDTPWHARVTLAFPETARRWPKLVDELTALEAPFGLGAQPLAGCQALVLTARADLRRMLRETVEPLGLMAEFATTLAEARDAGRKLMPQVILADAHLPEVERLCNELKAGSGGPALILLMDGNRSFEVSTTGRREVTRLGREMIGLELPMALRYALSPS
jgi:hypothetical protein